jgi:ATP-binding cassette subfamily B protein
MVLQDTYLFSESVADNIRYGKLDATDAEVIGAAKLANAHSFIMHMSEGYDTVLADNASNISQGQRQLIAIARAILADPRVLILDEATSSIDTRTELKIQEALLTLMKGRTSFIIAHRLSTIKNADCILVIDQGRIVEKGTHTELLEQKGFYANLYNSQFKTGMAV